MILALNITPSGKMIFWNLCCISASEFIHNTYEVYYIVDLRSSDRILIIELLDLLAFVGLVSVNVCN